MSPQSREGGPGSARERLERFARAESGCLHGFFRRALGDGDAALDLVQETLMEACRKLHLYDPSRPFGCWIFRIGQNRLRNLLRRKGVERKGLRVLEARAGGATPADEAERRAIESEDRRITEMAVAALPLEERLCIVLRYQEDLSCAEIGEILGSSPNAVSIHLHRARRRLRETMACREDR
jgi:RNA polymerase sigma factor (sigma-70 family)